MKKCMKKMLALLLACTICMGLIPMQVSAQSLQIDPQAEYRLVNKATGKALIRTDDNTYAAGRADVYKVAAAPYDKENDFEKWTISSAMSGKYQLKNVGDGISGLHKTNESYENISGANHVVTVENLSAATPQQNFTIIDAGDGYVKLLNEYDEGKNTYDKPQYLSVTQDRFNGSADTVYVALTAQSDTDSQLWLLEQVEGTGTKPPEPLDPFEPQQPVIQDTLTRVEDGAVTLTGYVDEAIRHVQDDELKVWDWKKLVEQFRSKTDTDDKWRGEFWGKYMRGACFTYSYTQDEELYAIIEESVRDLLSTQELSGRISTYPNDWGLWDIWCRKYVMLGLESFYDICKDETFKEEILTALCYHADYMIERLGPASEGKIELVNTGYWNGVASSSILEPMVRLYNYTGFNRYLDFATYIVNSGCTNLGVNVFELAYEGKQIPSEYAKNTVKAYELTSCFEGLAEYYRVTGIEKWRTACLNYYRLASEAEITIAGSGGGAGSGAGYSYYNPGQVEHWNHLAVNQSDPTMTQMQETCITVTWMKYCFQMLRLAGDSTIADDLECSIYNALLAAIKAEGVETPDYPYIFDYFTSLNGTKPNPFGGAISDAEGPIGSCCSANGPSAMGIIPFIEVMNAESGPVVNLYNAGEIRTQTPSGTALTLNLDTEYPVEETVTISVTPETAESFTVKLRIPAWSERTTIAVNGEEQDHIVSGTYYEIDRVWNPGDQITLTFDMRTRIINDPAGNEKIALKRGPVVLARDARFADGDVNTVKELAVDADGFAVVTPIESPFKSRMAFAVSCKDGSSFSVCDYSSAGQTWSSESRYATWLSVTGTLEIEEGVPYYISCPTTGKAATIAASQSIMRGDLPAGDEIVADRAWVFEKSGDYYLIRNPESGLYITATGTGNGSDIVAAAYTGDASQQWKLTMADRTSFKMESVLAEKLFSEAGDSENIHLWEDVKNPIQQWVVTPCPQTQSSITAQVTDQAGNPIHSVVKDEIFYLRVDTPSDVKDLYVVNEYGLYVSKRSVEKKETTEGTNWIVGLSVGTVGTGRVLALETVDAEGTHHKTDVTVTFDVIAPAPRLTEVSVEHSGRVNLPFTLTAVTSKDTAKLQIFNENGLGMGQISSVYEDTEQGRVWTVQLKAGTAGTRRFIVKACSRYGTISDALTSNEIVIRYF